MRMFWFVLCLLLAPVVGQAAYQNPTKESVQNLADGSTQITFRFTGNAGEPTVEIPLRLTVGMTASDVRRWVGQQLTRLDGQMTIRQAVDALVGPVPPLSPAAPPTPPAPTALEVCQQKYARYREFTGSGLGGAFVTALSTLKSNIEATCAGELLP